MGARKNFNSPAKSKKDLNLFPDFLNCGRTMSTTSQKHRNFIAEPMSDKPGTALAGIGETLGKRLSSKGFDKAYVVLGQSLVLKKNRDLFVDWLKDYAGANAKQSADCYQCLSDWCDEFL